MKLIRRSNNAMRPCSIILSSRDEDDRAFVRRILNGFEVDSLTFLPVIATKTNTTANFVAAAHSIWHYRLCYCYLATDARPILKIAMSLFSRLKFFIFIRLLENPPQCDQNDATELAQTFDLRSFAKRESATTFGTA